MRPRRAFTLVELLVSIGIIGLLISILLPTIARVRSAAKVTACASNLRQIGIGLTRYFNDFHHLPIRDNSGDLTLSICNPHVFRYISSTDDVSDLMENYIGSKKVFYCPANDIGRTPEDWWPYQSGTISGTYQFPFWLNDQFWLVPYPDYRHLTSERILAADYFGCILRTTGDIHAVAWNHERAQDGSPIGMNMLFGDGHVSWKTTADGWQFYGVSFANVYWFLSKTDRL